MTEESTFQKMARLLDEKIIEVLDQGEVVTKNGEAVLDKDGEPVRVTPSASMLNTARQRVAMLANDAKANSPVEFPAGLAEMAEKALGPVDVEGDDPATS